MATPDTTQWTKDDWDRFKQMNEDFGPAIMDMAKGVKFNSSVDKDVVNFYHKHLSKKDK